MDHTRIHGPRTDFQTAAELRRVTASLLRWMKVIALPLLSLVVTLIGAGCAGLDAKSPSAATRRVDGAVIGHRVDEVPEAHDFGAFDRRYVVAQPPPLPASTPRHLKPVRPAREAVWIDGYWAYTGDPRSPYEWMAGHWEIPPPGARAWVPSGWQRTGNTYVYIRGRWQ
jgi:hypothetical protein